MAQRLTPLTPDQLDDEQRAVYEGITGGDRLKGTQPMTNALDAARPNITAVSPSTPIAAGLDHPIMTPRLR